MKRVDLTEAKRLFLDLVAEVERGEIVVITRRGRVVARMIKENQTAPIGGTGK